MKSERIDETIKAPREDFNVSANAELHKAVLAARRAGKRYGGKLISCTMAFELGAKILLCMEDQEEATLLQSIEEIKIQKTALDQQERMRLEQLNLMKASKTAKMIDATDHNNDIQMLAEKIIEVWDNVILYKNHSIIESLVNIDKTRLNKTKVLSVFPKKYTQKPSIEEAVKLAFDLIEGETVDA
jgi:hypothetical protein